MLTLPFMKLKDRVALITGGVTGIDKVSNLMTSFTPKNIKTSFTGSVVRRQRTATFGHLIITAEP